MVLLALFELPWILLAVV